MSDLTGVLFMAYGGPDSLSDIGGYLADIRSGRTTSRSVLEDITYNYERIGGRSPLRERTQETIDAVMRELEDEGFRAYLGMRHWAPWIEETVGQMIDDGVKRAVSIVMAPHYSRLSIAKYQQKITHGLRMYRGSIEFRHVNSYYDAPGLIEALAGRVHEGINRWPEAERSGVHVVFSAHSLPARILQQGDPYEQQLLETARRVAVEANVPRRRWSWCWQSAGRSAEPWLGPQLEEHLEALAAQHITQVVSVPVGFVSDHVEVLYDIDIKAQRVARRCGMRLERPPALNDDPIFTRQLAAIVYAEAMEAGWLN